MSDSSAIDAGLLTLLSGDATLTGLLPDGVYFDEAPQAATRFVLLSLLDEHDEAVFGGRAFEDALYLVKAVTKGDSGSVAKTAAARIDVLLNDTTSLAATGYHLMAVFREVRVRHLEIDEVDPSIRWHHRGGHYRVQMSVA